MSRPRIKIAHLVILVLLSGAAMGALKSPTPLVASAMFTGLVAFLFVSVVAALRAGEPRRTFWLGCAVFGWGYGLITFAPGTESLLAPQLLTTHLIVACAPGEQTEVALTLSNPPSTTLGLNTMMIGSGSNTTTSNSNSTFATLALASAGRSGPLVYSLSTPTPDPSFLRIGQALAVLLVALLGGVLARLFFAPVARVADESDKVATRGEAA